MGTRRIWNSRNLYVAVAVGLCAALLALLSASAAPGVSSLDIPLLGRQVRSSPVGSSAQYNGVTITIEGVYADATQTVLSVSVNGQHSLGDWALPTGLSLVGTSGRLIPLEGGQPDPDNPRNHTLLFGPLSPGETVEVRVKTVVFASTAQLEEEERGGGPAATTSMSGQWLMRFSAPSHSPSVRTFGRWSAVIPGGLVVVDEVIVSDVSTLVRGHLEGIPSDEIPLFRLDPTLVLASGETLPFISLRGGYGESRELFEVRFAPSHGSATLRIALVPSNFAIEHGLTSSNSVHGPAAEIDVVLD